MADMIPFRYGGFWDVPRYIVLRYRDGLLYVQSAFDEELDDYPDNYSVYKIPTSAEPSIEEGSWEFLSKPQLV